MFFTRVKTMAAVTPMIDPVLYGEIRRLAIQGVSQRKIAKQLNISRTAVAKYRSGAHIPGQSEPRAPNESADKAAIKDAIRKYCEDHRDDQTRKHKINGHTLWRDLHYEYPRSEVTYRRYWAEIRGERQVRTRMPLMFKIAEAAQVDWKMAKVRPRGGELDVHVLCVNLMYANTPFKKAYPNEKQYNLIDGLISAMEFFQGAPGKFIMDNMTAARKKGYGKEAVLTDEFKLFAAHYGVEIEFANPYEAPEKGCVEVAAKTAGGILTPIPDIEDISEVNDMLLAECRYYIEHTGRIGNRPRTVKEMTLEERPHLTPLPIKRYEAGIHDSAFVNNQQLFKFDGHTYSAPRPYAGKEIGIIAYSFRIELFYRGQKIWECDRPLFDHENRVFPEHYLYDLDIKPRSRENAFPLLEGILPPELHRFRKLCNSKNTKCYQLYMLMRLIQEVGRDKLLKAVDIANDKGCPTLAKVEHILSLDLKGAANGPNMDRLDKAILDDDFYVEQREPSDYDSLWGAASQPQPQK
jgi:transposase